MNFHLSVIEQSKVTLRTNQLSRIDIFLKKATNFESNSRLVAFCYALFHYTHTNRSTILPLFVRSRWSNAQGHIPLAKRMCPKRCRGGGKVNYRSLNAFARLSVPPQCGYGVKYRNSEQCLYFYFNLYPQLGHSASSALILLKQLGHSPLFGVLISSSLT